MHTFLNRKLTIAVCIAVGGFFAVRAQVQPLPVIPPDALVQTYTGRLAYTLQNDYVKWSDTVYRNGKLYFKNNVNYIGVNPQGLDTLTICSPWSINLFSTWGSVNLKRSPNIFDSSNCVATTKFVKRALEQTFSNKDFISNDDARLSDSRTPTGTAGGDLSGTYPNPTIKASVNLTGNPTVAGKLTVNGTDESLIKGNLRLKGSGAFGNKLNFGDGDYVYLHEATDDNLTVKAKNIELVPTVAVTAPTPATTDNSTKIATTAYVQNNLANFSNLPVVIAAGQLKRIAPTDITTNWRITSQNIGSATIENYNDGSAQRCILTVNGMTADCIVLLYSVNGEIFLTRQGINSFEVVGHAWGNSYHTNYYTVLKLQ